MDTLYLNPATWDLVLDSSANIARATIPYALAQDAASAIKTFAGEVYYNTLLGIPYFEQVLGHYPPLPIFKALLIAAALTVPGVIAAEVFISSTEGRTIVGQVQVTDTEGVLSVASF